MSKNRVPSRLLVVAFALPLVNACKEPLPPTTGFSTTTPPSEGLVWEACGANSLQCTTLDVPLDHADPGVGSTRLTLSVLPAGDGASEGVIFVNPGGPGAAALPFVEAMALLLPELARRYDFAGVEPRGGGDRPLGCFKEAIGLLDVELAPTTAQEVDAMLDANRAWTDVCMAESGELIPYATLPDMADDLAFAATALGQERFGYYGVSAGTFLGALLAEQHPDRLWAVALDSVGPTSSADELNELQLDGMIGVLNSWESWCLADQATPGTNDYSLCPLGDQPLEELWSALDLIQEQQITDPDSGRRLNHTRAVFGVAKALYSEWDWPLLAFATRDVLTLGDPFLFQMLSDAYFEEHADDGLTGGSFAAYNALMCSMGTTSRSAEQLLDDALSADARLPHLGALSATATSICDGLPEPRRPLTGPVAAADAPPILLLQSEGDFATPLAGAERVHDALANSAMVRWSGATHGTAFASECARQHLIDYLADGVLPPDGTRCTD